MKRYNNNNILVISDTHAPFHHKDTLNFLYEVCSVFNVDRVIHCGDLTDSYCFSGYAKAVNSDNAPTEIKKMRAFVKNLKELIPEMSLMISNHDDRLYRKAKSVGIPRETIVPYSTFVGADDVDWKWHYDLTLTVDSTRERIYFVHTKTGTTTALAKSISTNVVTGHKHTEFGVSFLRTPVSEVWALDAGCLISDEGHAFSYNNMSLSRPVRGVTVIQDGHPVLIPMRMSKNGKDWSGRL